jgi:hypothetical protein
MHDLQWRVLLESTQPILLCDNLTFHIAEGFMKLIVISELKLCENLIYRIDTVELGVIVKLASGFRHTFANNWNGSIPPNFGQRFAGIFL